MKVLMTGGTGFVGQRIGMELAQRGYEITVLTRSPEKARRAATFPANFVHWDAETFLDPAVFESVEGLIHLAGESIAEGRWTVERKKALWNSRVQGTEHLVQALEKSAAKLKWAVAASATGFYGFPGDDLVDEDASQGNGFLAELCAAWEQAILKISQVNPEARLSLFRIGVVLGEGGGFFNKLVPLFQNGLGAALGAGKQWMSWVDIVDLVRLFLWAIDNPKAEGVYNATAPQPATNVQLTKALASRLGVSILPPVPAPMLKLLYGEMAQMLLGSIKAHSTRLEKEGFQFQVESVEQAFTMGLPVLRTGERQKVYRQWLAAPIDNVFAFFEEARNLEKITPPFLQFKVLSQSTDKIEQGTVFEYQIRLRGVPLNWRTEIVLWEPPHRFADNQDKGPYAKWHHVHEFVPLGNGTLMTDRVTFKLPLGLVGRSVAGSYVSSDIDRIFQFRRDKAYELFGSSSKS